MARGLKGAVYQTGPTGETHVFPAGTTKAKLPDWVVVDDGAFDTAPGADDEPADVAPVAVTADYEEHKVADLKAEVARRNAERGDGDDLVVVDEPGNKADLVKALTEDDAAHQG